MLQAKRAVPKKESNHKLETIVQSWPGHSDRKPESGPQT